MPLEHSQPKENLREMYPLTPRLKKLDIKGALDSTKIVTIGEDGIRTLSQALSKLFPEDIPNKKALFSAVLARAVDKGFNVNFLRKGDQIGINTGFLFINEKGAPKAWEIALYDGAEEFKSEGVETFDPRSRVVAKARRAWESIREADDTRILQDAMESRAIASTRANREELWRMMQEEHVDLPSLRGKIGRLNNAPDDLLENDYGEHADHFHFLALIAYLQTKYPSGPVEAPGLERVEPRKKTRRKERAPRETREERQRPAPETKPPHPEVEHLPPAEEEKILDALATPPAAPKAMPAEKLAEINFQLRAIDPGLSLTQEWPLALQKLNGTAANEPDPANFVLLRLVVPKSTIREVSRSKKNEAEWNKLQIVNGFYIPYPRDEILNGTANTNVLKQLVRDVRDYAENGGHGMRRDDKTEVSNARLLDKVFYSANPNQYQHILPPVGPEPIASADTPSELNKLRAELNSISPNLVLIKDASNLGSFGVITPEAGPKKYTPPSGTVMLHLRIEDSTLADPLGEEQAFRKHEKLPPPEKDFYLPYDIKNPPTRQYLIESVRRIEAWATHGGPRPPQVLLLARHPSYLTAETKKLEDVQEHAKDVVPKLTAIMERGGWKLGGVYLTAANPFIAFEDPTDPAMRVTVNLIPGPDGKRAMQFVNGGDALDELTRVYEDSLKDLNQITEQIKALKAKMRYEDAEKEKQKGRREVAEKGPSATKAQLLGELKEFGTRLEGGGRPQTIGGRSVDYFSIDPGDGFPVEVAVFIVPIDPGNEAAGYQYRCVVLDGLEKIADFVAPRANLARAMVRGKTLAVRQKRNMEEKTAPPPARAPRGEQNKNSEHGEREGEAPNPALPVWRGRREPLLVERPRDRVTWDVSNQEVRRLAGYHDFHFEEHNDAQKSRTYAGRHNDHIDLLRDMRGGRGDAAALGSEFFTRGATPVFVDIGPGVAHTKEPAISSLEIARSFPDMKVYALDLPEEVDKYRTKVPADAKAALEASSVRIVSGDGLKSLKAQIPELAALHPNTPVVIRSVNAIDIYCDWKKEVKPALEQMAKDFRSQPVVLLFNKEIMYKPADSLAWKIVGQVSNRGFQHNSTEFNGRGVPPYKLKQADIRS